MSVRKAVVLLVALSAFAFLAACGGNGSPPANPTPPPSGGFSNSALNGTYVFSVSGTDSAGDPYAILGTLTANGSGGITGGAIDMNDTALTSGSAPNLPLSGSSNYKIGVDGRGLATLNISGSSPFGNTITLDFVLQDNSHGLVTEFDSNASGSGTLDLQTKGAAASGPYAYSLSGSEFSGTPAAAVGYFSVSGGAITTGVSDFNAGAIPYTNQSLTGQVKLGPSSTPSTTLDASGFGGMLTFDAVAIDSTHLKFIEMDQVATMSGDAFSATSSAIPTGNLAFTMIGGVSTPVAAGGFIVTDGAGNITNASSEDLNSGGTVSTSPISFTGTYTSTGSLLPARSVLTLSGFDDGATSSASYAAYPSSGGTLLLEIDSAGILSGAAYTQTSTSFSETQGYAFNLAGANLSAQVEVDDIAEFAGTSGIIDENDAPGGSPNYGISLSSITYAAPSGGRGQISAVAQTNSNSTINGGFIVTFYSVDGTMFPFIETDSGGGQIAAGVFLGQSSSSSSVAMPHAMYVPHVLSFHPHGAKSKKD
jgi:hypothetical protein